MITRRNREINIVNISMLDVLSGALGAVLIVMAILSERPEKPPEDLENRVKQLEKQVDELNGKLRIRRPLAIQTWWSGSDDQDVDLYVRFGQKDPPPDLNKAQWPRYKGDARINSRRSARSETWLMRDVPAGDYEVYLKLMGDRAGLKPVLAWAWVQKGWDQPNRSNPIGSVRLDAGKRVVLLGTLTMASDGSLTTKIGPGVQPIPQSGG